MKNPKFENRKRAGARLSAPWWKLARFFLLAVAIIAIQQPAHAQINCPSGIAIHVNSSDNMITIWSPLSNGDYHISRGWNANTHTNKDRYALDLNIAGTSDKGKAVFLPIPAESGRLSGQAQLHRRTTVTPFSFGIRVAGF